MIIGITGLIGSGKDTIADYLCRFHGFKRLSFASSLKDAVSFIFGWDREMLEGVTSNSRVWRERRDEWWSNRLGMDITPRWILQYWGTEVCRNNFHQDIWVASVENKLRSTADNIVITDCRFSNELASIKSVGGLTCRVERGQEPLWIEIAKTLNQTSESEKCAGLRLELSELGIHPSEYSSVGLNYDVVIKNNGSLELLYQQVNDLLVNHQVSK